MTDPDRTEDWLREGLAGAVPDPPGEPGRAAAARRRARQARRRTALVAAAGVAATLAVVGAVSTSLRDGSTDETATATTSAFDVPACPSTPVDTQTQVGPDHVPDGAVSVRLCGNSAPSEDVPRDALVTEVDEVADTVNSLEPADPRRVCSLELASSYQLVFGYRDGTTVAASGNLYGCRNVVVNGVERTGADAPWERFAELLRKQRESLDPPTPVDPSGIDCATNATPGTPGLGRLEELATASFCSESEYAQWTEVEIPSEDLAVLVADAASVEEPGCEYGGDAALDKIVGRSAWGDRVELAPTCPSVSHLAVDWSRESLAILQQLGVEARKRG